MEWYPLTEAKTRDSWTTIREQLRDWCRVKSALETAEGGRIENIQDEEADEEAAAIAVAVGLETGAYRKRVFRGVRAVWGEAKSVVPR